MRITNKITSTLNKYIKQETNADYKPAMPPVPIRISINLLNHTSGISGSPHLRYYSLDGVRPYI